MAFIMKLVGLASGEASPYDDQYLAEYDPDRDGVDPNGTPTICHFVATPDPRQALRFATPLALLALWKRTSGHRPVRPDGQPNRPLTAFMITAEHSPTEENAHGMQ